MEESRPTWGHLAGGWAAGSDALHRGGLDGPGVRVLPLRGL